MAGQLTARKVETAKPGKYSDGGNLYLIVFGNRCPQMGPALHLAQQGERDGTWQRRQRSRGRPRGSQGAKETPIQRVC